MEFLIEWLTMSNALETLADFEGDKTLVKIFNLLVTINQIAWLVFLIILPFMLIKILMGIDNKLNRD